MAKPERWPRHAEVDVRLELAIDDDETVLLTSLATASVRDGTAFVGADADYDAVSEVAIERFRADPA